MSKLGDALRARYKTPVEAMKALDLDPTLLRDVLAHDSKEKLMSKPTRLAALALNVTTAHVSPRLAMDIALPKSLFSDITTKNFKAKRPDIVSGVKKASDGKLLKGFALDEGGLEKLLDALEDTAGESADESVSEAQHNAMEAAAQGESDLGIPKAVGEEFSQADKGKSFDAEPLMAFLKEKGIGEDDLAQVTGMLPKPEAHDEDDEERKKREAEEAAKKAASDEEKDEMVTKPAMDAAIKAATDKTAAAVRAQMIADQKAIREAEKDVKPWVSDIGMAHDSAEAVYRTALGALGEKDIDDLPLKAMQRILHSKPKPGDRQRATTVIAQDGAAPEDFATRFPGAARVL